MLRTLYPQGKSPWYPLDRLCGPQSRSGRGDEKNSQPLPGLESPIIQPLAQRYAADWDVWIVPFASALRMFRGFHT
jgi:hypothetical protein